MGLGAIEAERFPERLIIIEERKNGGSEYVSLKEMIKAKNNGESKQCRKSVHKREMIFEPFEDFTRTAVKGSLSVLLFRLDREDFFSSVFVCKIITLILSLLPDAYEKSRSLNNSINKSDSILIDHLVV